LSSPIIQVNNLSKSYTISHEGQERYTALRDVIAQRTKKIFSFGKRSGPVNRSSSTEEFFALKDVSFNIRQGDRVGIIGRNGAGKSTLLKIISRITEPTTGTVKIKGRVASLLEVGTGFHPELTGRENIFLNGAILGMTRAEIKSQFDAIVDFAEIEKFLDTPVKRYSSGMYVRLAFAVAAHMEPEILVVDEVLAVGDAQFQKKCLGKMEDVSKNGGRTVLFVSHNMNMISKLCNTGILLQHGQIVIADNIYPVIDKYKNEKQDMKSRLSQEGSGGLPVYENEFFKINDFYLKDVEGDYLPSVVEARNLSEIEIYIEGEIKEKNEKICIGFDVFNEKDEQLFYTFQTDQPEAAWPKLEKGPFVLKATLPVTYFNEGKYFINLIAALHAERMLLTSNDEKTLSFELVGNRSESPYWQGKKHTVIAPVIKFIKL